MTSETDDTKKKRFNGQPIHQQAKSILEQLTESNYRASGQLHRLIRLCGIEYVEVLLAETFQIEAEGGMLTSDGSRQRSRGGIFFRLAKDRLTDEQRRIVFPYRSQKERRKHKQITQKRRDRRKQGYNEEIISENMKVSKDDIQFQVENLSPEVRRLVEQADDLRQKITERESSGGSGVKMLQTMLDKIEKQIEQAIQSL